MKIQEERQASKQKQGYTATLSHEMVTPLANALFFIKEVKKNEEIKKSAQGINYLVLVETQLTFMQTFVDDLLDLQRIESG